MADLREHDIPVGLNESLKIKGIDRTLVFLGVGASVCFGLFFSSLLIGALTMLLWVVGCVWMMGEDPMYPTILLHAMLQKSIYSPFEFCDYGLKWKD